MQKMFYLLYEEASVDGAKIHESLDREAVPTIRAAGGKKLCLFVNDSVVSAGQSVPRSDPPIRAMLSFWLGHQDDRGPIESSLSNLARRIAGYSVIESRPLEHTKTKGRRTQGMTQISCIEKLPALSQREFLEIWQVDHQKVALETQSTFGYVRNEVVEVVTGEATDGWSAIVEERFPIEALTDSLVFFDSENVAGRDANLQRMLASCRRFMRLDSVEVTFASEYDYG